MWLTLTSAFDSVNHEIILWKLKHQFKIDGHWSATEVFCELPPAQV